MSAGEAQGASAENLRSATFLVDLLVAQVVAGRSWIRKILQRLETKAISGAIRRMESLRREQEPRTSLLSPYLLTGTHQGG